jgi:DNA gyrase/topoisomerase IV subunit B
MTFKLLTARSHILMRPARYIGDINTSSREMWVIDNNQLVYKEVNYNIGYIKCIMEILDNSVDEFIKTKGKKSNIIKIEIDQEKNITIIDNGRGVPTDILTHNDEGDKLEDPMPKAAIAFTSLMSGTNFEDERDSIGLHGEGASICNVLSEYFIVSTSDNKNQFDMTCKNNMDSIDYKLSKSKNSKTYTEIKFKLDDKIFQNTHLLSVEDIRTIIEKRLLEIKLSYKIKFTLNGKVIKNNILDYIPEQTGILDEDNMLLAITFNNSDARNLSYVNSVNTYDGGNHYTMVNNEINNTLREYIDKKFKYDLKPSLLQKHFSFLLSIKIKNPEFDSQNKTRLVNKDLKDILPIEKVQPFIKKLFKENLDYWNKIVTNYKKLDDRKRLIELQKKQKKIKTQEITNFIDIEGKSRNKKDYCNAVLCLFEGLSAISNLMRVRDNTKHAGYALKGKVMNTYEMKDADVLKNKEIQEILTICGLKFGDSSGFKWKEVAICTDADEDGCLRGDTEIQLLNGETKTMEKLSELYPDDKERFYVFSKDENGKTVPGLAHSVRITKYIDKLLKITLDNGKEIFVTHNHPFLKREGNYVNANELKIGDSLMSLYLKKFENCRYKDYWQIYLNEINDYKLLHRYIASLENDIPKGYVVHHKDENKDNNNPNNLLIMKKHEHISLHGKNSYLVNVYNGSEKQKQDLKNNKELYSKLGKNSHLVNVYNGSEKNSKVTSERNKRMWKNEEYRKHMRKKNKEFIENGGSEIISKNTENQWKDPNMKFKMQATRIVNVIKKALDKFGIFNEENYENVRPKYGIPKYNLMMKKMNFKNDEEATLYAINYNHKVIAIEEINLNNKIPVYDMTVDKYHNFAIKTSDNSSVFVHNSHIFTLLIALFTKYFPELIESGKIVRYLSPIVIANKTDYFYSYDEWKKHMHKYEEKNIEYLKGLASLDDKDYHKMINKPTKIIVSLGEDYEETMDMAFSKKRADDRKEWLKNG